MYVCVCASCVLCTLYCGLTVRCTTHCSSNKHFWNSTPRDSQWTPVRCALVMSENQKKIILAFTIVFAQKCVGVIAFEYWNGDCTQFIRFWTFFFCFHSSSLVVVVSLWNCVSVHTCSCTHRHSHMLRWTLGGFALLVNEWMRNETV